MSSRPSASVVIGLAVASLAVTSMGATVASSELLVDAVDRLARRRPAPLVLDLGSVGTIPAELPRDAGPPRPPARRPPAADPTPPRPPGPAAPPTADREGGDGGRVVVAHTQVVRRIVIRKPVFLPPPRPPVPPRPPAHWPRRRWAAHHRHHHHHRQHRRQPCGERRWRWKHDDPPSRALSGQRARGCHPARARHRTRCPRGRA